MNSIMIRGVPHVLVELAQLHKLLHKAFGDDMLRQAQAPSDAEPVEGESQLMDRDMAAIESGAMLLVETWQPDGEERIGEYEFEHRLMW